MRIGCSSLKSQLCHNLHVEDNPSCNCGHLKETPEHLFLGCPLYYEQRRELFNVLDQESTTTCIILNGNSDTSVDENIRNMDAIYQYTRDSGRFSFRF